MVFLLDFFNQLLLPLPFHCPGFLQCLWTAGVYLRVGNRQLFVPSSKKVPVNHLAIIVRFLLPVFVAKMESIVYESMVFFLRSNSLISKDQFGFLARRSTCTQLLITLNEWTLLTEIRSKIDSVYIDFAKAFDSISPRKLLYKVECYGFTLGEVVIFISYESFSASLY